MANDIQQIEKLFDNESDINKLKTIFDINLDSIYTGMTEFQIKHFVLNRKEFTNDLHMLNQAKFEIWGRVRTFLDLYYSYQKYQAEMELAEGEIEDLQIDNTLNPKKKHAKIRLQEIEIEKNKWLLESTKKEAQKVLTECSYFHDIYDQFRDIDNLPPEEYKRQLEEGWLIKSAYFTELQERYGLTPGGFVKLPHEEGGLQILTEKSNSIKKCRSIVIER